MPRIVLDGQRFGRWVAIVYRGRCRYLCRCDCGTEREVFIPSLRRGVSRSCGCLHVELLRARATTHGLTGTSEHKIWKGIRKRCSNARTEMFSHYGGRGIRVCERWESFENFLADMGPRPSPRHSLDRIDNDGHYEPGNCRWATRKEQTRNRRKTKFVTWKGERRSVPAWAELLGIPCDTLYHRLERWSVERAFTSPYRRAA